MKFKVGDKVRVIYPSSDRGGFGGFAENQTLILVQNMDGYDDSWITDYRSYSIKENQIELINSNKTMNLKEKFTQIFLQEPEKTFRKAGITNGDGILTDDGQKIFLTWMLGKNGAEFKTAVVDPILAEEKE